MIFLVARGQESGGGEMSRMPKTYHWSDVWHTNINAVTVEKFHAIRFEMQINSTIQWAFWDGWENAFEVHRNIYLW